MPTDDQCLEQLRTARAFIERGWCKYFRAVDAKNRYTDPTAPTAVQWCALGAVDAAIGRYVWEDDCPIQDLARHVPPSKNGVLNAIADYNNSRCKEDVLKLFDLAIADHMLGVGFAYFRSRSAA